MTSTAIYCRVSTDRQEHRSQLRAICDWLVREGMSWRDARWYRDRGVSSALLSRPAFDRLMVDAEAGNVSRVVVYKLDRIGRWGEDDYMLWRIAMKRRGVEIVSVAGEVTTWDSLGDKIMGMVMAHADREWLTQHRRRVSQGIRASKVYRDGDWGTANPNHPLHHEDVFDLDEGRRLLAGGASFREVARELGCTPSMAYRRLK